MTRTPKNGYQREYCLKRFSVQSPSSVTVERSYVKNGAIVIEATKREPVSSSLAVTVVERLQNGLSAKGCFSDSEIQKFRNPDLEKYQTALYDLTHNK